MKSPWLRLGYGLVLVAPLAGAWIEIQSQHFIFLLILVAPLAGAWIEMPSLNHFSRGALSLPSRERGLKWQNMQALIDNMGRSPRGSVD